MSQISVKSLWIDTKIGELQKLCIKSFLAKGVKFILYTYEVIENLPDGVVTKDANNILCKSKIFKDNKNSYATFSDWFRIKLLFEIGGWWVDCDVLCIKKFSIMQPYVFATEGFGIGDERKISICNAVIKMPRQSIIGRKILFRINKKINDGSVLDIDWTEIGAKLLVEEIYNANLIDFVVIPEVFCPNDFMNFKDLIQKNNVVLDKRTYGIHLWNKMWEWNKIDPITMIAKDSILDKARAE